MTQAFARGQTPVYWRRLWAPRNPVLTDAGAAGELIVARARLAFASLIVLVPLVSIVREPAHRENWVGFVAASTSVALSALVLSAVRRGWRPGWIGVVTCLYDVSMVSCVLLGLLVVGSPAMAINSRVTFEVYFLALAATCLRYDRRVCMITGLAAAVQYSLIVLVALHVFAAAAGTTAPTPYGTFSAGDQIGRVILLLVATLLSATIVDRVERLRVLSTHDSLTGLYNRAYFDERLQEELLRARRYGRPLAVAILDIDHFKQVNDQFGHVSGDVALRAFSALLRDGMRRTDIVSRYGGEEFALILPETTGEGACAKLDRMREDVASQRIALPRVGSGITLTFSGGVATMPLDGERVDELVARADARLLAAKGAGRNRVLGPPPR